MIGTIMKRKKLALNFLVNATGFDFHAVCKIVKQQVFEFLLNDAFSKTIMNVYINLSSLQMIKDTKSLLKRREIEFSKRSYVKRLSTKSK